MNSPFDVFCEIPCLSEKTRLLRGIDLSRIWFKAADKRRIGDYLLKFVNYNQRLFDFLGVTPSVVGIEQNSSITFRSSNFIGAIPLRAPDTGKQIGDFIVSPRFSTGNRYSEYIEILNMLNDQINYESLNSLPLVSGRVFRPPFYYEACKFIDLLCSLVKVNWPKFTKKEKSLREPMGDINWRSYIRKEYRPEERIKFPVIKNFLTEEHIEYSYLKYVFGICKNELLSNNTPINIKIDYRSKIQLIEQNLESQVSTETNEIPLHFSDPLLVKKCKTQANKILSENFSVGIAWRVDFAEVFERYVQYIFSIVAKENGGCIYLNHQISGIQQDHYYWEIKYLEPDALYQKNKLSIMIDAKYKAHLYNKWESSDFLKSEFRKDLHQILSYSSFDAGPEKYCFLCYPSSNVEISKIKYHNSNNRTSTILSILGIPLSIRYLSEVTKILLSTISQFEKSLLSI